MFYKNVLKTPKKTKKTLKFNVFDQKTALNDENSVFNAPATSYNFSLDKGVLSSDFGIQDFAMPTSPNKLETDTVIPIDGKVKRMWSFTWYSTGNDVLNYYLFYFNDENKLVYENLFNVRPFRFTVATEYTSTPVGVAYRIDHNDYMIFSTKEGQVYVYGNGYNKYLPDAPKFISICAHDELLFALSATERHSLVFSDNKNILEWQDDTAKHIEFSDERGNLNKLISFDNYLYIFRDFGITRITSFSMEGDYNAQNIYLSTSYIHPGSIAYDGENAYFLTDDGFYSFDGNNVRKIDFVTNGLHLNSCNAACYQSKYYLACRKDYADKIGCETGEFTNNVVLIYDTQSGTIEFVRGIDVNQILPILNPLKCKLALCFNGENENRIAEVTNGSKFFDENVQRLWESVQSDLGLGDSDKKLECFFVKTNGDVKISFIGDKGSKTHILGGSEKLQRIKCGLNFKTLKVKIESSSEDIKISNFQIEVSVQ